jgi:hypothetical protein
MRKAGMNGFKSPLGESNFGRYNDLCSPSGPDAALTRRDFFLAASAGARQNLQCRHRSLGPRAPSLRCWAETLGKWTCESEGAGLTTSSSSNILGLWRSIASPASTPRYALFCRARLRSSTGDEPDPIERTAPPLGIAGGGLLLPAPQCLRLAHHSRTAVSILCPLSRCAFNRSVQHRL